MSAHGLKWVVHPGAGVRLQAQARTLALVITPSGLHRLTNRTLVSQVGGFLNVGARTMLGLARTSVLGALVCTGTNNPVYGP